MSCRLACILAAGMGTRLGPSERPKGLLQLGPKPLVERSLDQLFGSGVEQVILVTGHLASAYGEIEDDRVLRVHNPLYSDSGSLYSLWCARDHLTEPYLLLESDLLYEDRALTTVQEAPEEDLVLVSGFGGAGDEVFVEAHNGRLIGLSKDRAQLGASPLGEFVGICKISTELSLLLMNYLETRMPETIQLDYESDGLAFCARDRVLPCHLVEDLIWTEIDDSRHLEYARARILPRLQDSGANWG